MAEPTEPREGSLEAPIRHAIDWRAPEYTDTQALDTELERVFDICHGCRRCFSLCNAFPTLFDLIDESASGELDEVPKSSFKDVVDHCYLCDMCYMTKCPYVPPHPWNIDFPHLMLRAKVKSFTQQGVPLRDRMLSATKTVGRIVGIPVVAQIVNAANGSRIGRQLLQKTLGVHADAPVPKFHSNTARRRLRSHVSSPAQAGPAAADDRIVVFATCYGDRNLPELVEDLVAVLEHNGVQVALTSQEQCCGMPKLELGDLASVERFKNANIEQLHAWVEQGWKLTAPVPSCVLMFKQELPLLFAGEPEVAAVGAAFVDPFEYLMQRHRLGRMKTNFKQSLGKISYQVPCHLRVQNIGLKTRDVLQLVPDTTVDVIERCSGHDGTYAVKQEFHAIARKIGRPVAARVAGAQAAHFTSDCPMAAEHIASMAEGTTPTHPLALLRRAYGI
jgi:glycerol-3-phosphate dehydrogenase subunit C